MNPKTSISRKLALLLLLIVAIVEGLLVAAAYFWQSSRIDASIKNQQTEIARITDESLVMPLWDLDYDQVRRLGHVIHQNVYVDDLSITSPDGKEIYYQSSDFFINPNVKQAKLLLSHNDTPIGIVHIGFDHTPGLSEKDFILTSLMLVYGASLILVLLLIRPLLKHLIQAPIAQVGEAMAMVADGDYQSSVDLETNEELADIVKAFSAMTTAIQSRESLIKDSEQKFREIFNATNEGILILDTDKIIDVNDTACAMIEAEREHVIGQSLISLVSVEPPHLVKEMISALALASAEPQMIECQLRKKQNDLFWADIAIKESEIQGERRIITAIRDITDKKEAAHILSETEERLRQAQKMEAVGQLAGGIAHDFNNLLQVINGHSQLLLDDIAKDSEHYHDILPISQAGDRAAELVKQLLTFSRRQIIQPQKLNLNEVIQDLLKMIRRLIGEDIDLSFQPTEEESFIRADKGMIDQILINLCVNARDAMPSGGHLQIKTEQVRFEEKDAVDHQWVRAGHYICIAIKDRGVGMEAAILKHIFEPFFTTKEQGKGTGLGLAMVYGIIRQHEGLIHVESEVGLGTTFYLYFPMNQTEDTKSPAIEYPSVPTTKQTILLAEDEPLVQDLAYQMLSKAGYTVIRASNGLEAIAKFHEHADKISILLLDVIMPGKKGREVMQEIHRTHPDLPVIFVSGYSESNIDTQFVLDDGLSLITKPFKRNELIAKIENELVS